MTAYNIRPHSNDQPDYHGDHSDDLITNQASRLLSWPSWELFLFLPYIWLVKLIVSLSPPSLWITLPTNLHVIMMKIIANIITLRLPPTCKKIPRLLNSKITKTTWDVVEPYNIWLGLALDFLQSSQHKLHYNLNCIVPKLSLNLVFHFLKLVFHKSSTQPTTKQGSPSSPSFCSILPIYNLLI